MGAGTARLCEPPDRAAFDDGLTLTDVYIAASVRCAPPDNQPAPLLRQLPRHLDAR